MCLDCSSNTLVSIYYNTDLTSLFHKYRLDLFISLFSDDQYLIVTGMVLRSG